MRTQAEFIECAEEYVDSAGLDNCIDALAEVCRLKAEHLETNWQDHYAASLWNTIAKRLDTASGSASDRGLTI